jgi:hypothetical protein
MRILPCLKNKKPVLFTSQPTPTIRLFLQSSKRRSSKVPAMPPEKMPMHSALLIVFVMIATATVAAAVVTVSVTAIVLFATAIARHAIVSATVPPANVSVSHE